jgi:hypothetical protein
VHRIVNRPHSAKFVFFALAAGCWFAAPASAQTVYKYLGPDGKVVYSDSAPPKGVKFEIMQTNTKPTGVTPLPGATPKTAQDAADMERDRKARQGEHDQLIAGAQQNYDSAVAELDAAKEPREGERSHNANGTSHLTEDYFARIAPLEKKVEELRIQLEQARRS